MSLRRIGDVAKELNLKPHVLRYWEDEFNIRPRRSKSGQRVYSDAQIQLLRQAYVLRYVLCFTVEGTRRYLKKGDGAEGLSLLVEELVDDRRTDP